MQTASERSPRVRSGRVVLIRRSAVSCCGADARTASLWNRQRPVVAAYRRPASADFHALLRVTPCGGMAFMLDWIALAVGVLRAPRRRS